MIERQFDTLMHDERTDFLSLFYFIFCPLAMVTKK